MSARRRPAVVGIGYSDIGRRLERPLGLLARDAARAAIADAGLRVEQIDGLSTHAEMPVLGNTGGAIDGVHLVGVSNMIESLRIGDAVRWYSQSARGALLGSVIEAANAIVAGACDYALVWRALHMPMSGRYTSWTSPTASGTMQFHVPYGILLGAVPPALDFRDYMHRFGASREQLGRFVVANRQRAQLNPNAYWRGRGLSLDEYMEARMIAEPLCIHDCDIPVDGAAAIIMTAAERAAELPHRPAHLLGWSQTTTPLEWFSTLGGDQRWESARAAGRAVWPAAGVAPGEIRAAMVYDGFSPFVYWWLEALGFCPRGEAPAFVAEAEVAPGGLAINTSGGSLGEGRMHGMAQVAEAVRQVSGRAGPRQVEGADAVVATVGPPGDIDAAAVVFGTEPSG